MAHIEAVDSEGSAGAPEAEIEVTPEMIEVGLYALSERDSRLELEEKMIERVFRAMLAKAPR